jgi:hypothetical protein
MSKSSNSPGLTFIDSVSLFVLVFNSNSLPEKYFTRSVCRGEWIQVPDFTQRFGLPISLSWFPDVSRFQPCYQSLNQILFLARYQSPASSWQFLERLIDWKRRLQRGWISNRLIPLHPETAIIYGEFGVWRFEQWCLRTPRQHFACSKSALDPPIVEGIRVEHRNWLRIHLMMKSAWPTHVPNFIWVSLLSTIVDLWSSMVSPSTVASDFMLRSSRAKIENWPSLGSCEHFAFLIIQLRLQSSVLPSDIWKIHHMRARRFINSFGNLESSRLYEKGDGQKSLNWFTDLAAQSPRSGSSGFITPAM